MLTTSVFTAFFKFVVWTMPSPCLATKVGDYSLYTFPFLGLARRCHVKGFTEFTPDYHTVSYIATLN